MGIPPGVRIKPRLERHLDDAVDEAARVARPRLVWRLGDAAPLDTVLPLNRRLARHLRDADRVALLAATVGGEWTARVRGERDPMRAYVLSAASTALARGVLVHASRILFGRFPGCGVTEPLSPGNDGLPLRIQKDLLAALPYHAIGIRFDEGQLVMWPAASVTAIIGFGPRLDPPSRFHLDCDDEPHCARCPSAGCALRLESFEPSVVARP